MTLITLKDGKPVLHAGKVGTEQACCCGPAECDEETVSYSYYDTIPPAPAEENCPNFSVCDGSFVTGWLYSPTPLFPSRVGDPGPGDCAGDTLTCYIRSKDFPIGCTSPKATVYAGGEFDDYGTISGAVGTITIDDACIGLGGAPGPPGSVATTTTLTPHVVDNGDGTQYLKLELEVINSPTMGGPYGVIFLTVRWWFG